MVFQLGTGIGTLVISWNDQGMLRRIDWSDQSLPQRYEGQWPIPAPASRLMEKLQGYFALGEPLGEVPWDEIDQSGWTHFQRQVYQAIVRIPHGETRTYGWVATRLGKFAATRAVGQALKNNPIPILIPCHRVVSATSLGGFMGKCDPNQPELELKRRLIAIEEEYRSPVFSFLTPSMEYAVTPGLATCHP